MYVAYRHGNKNIIWPHAYDGTIAEKKVLSHSNNTLENPANIKRNKIKGIAGVADGQMILIAMETICYMSFSDILSFTMSLDKCHMRTFMVSKITSALRQQLGSLNQDTCGFSRDLIQEKVSRRRWPCSIFSPPEWKALVAKNNVATNWMISAVIKIAGTEDQKAAENEPPYDFLEEIKGANIEQKLIDAVESGDTKTFANLALNIEGNSYIMDQYLTWLQTAEIPKQHRKMATSLGASQLAKKNGVNWYRNHEQTYIVHFADVSDHVSNLTKLRAIGLNDEYMTYICTLLSLPTYLLLLRETDVIAHMTKLMNDHPVYTDMVAVAMSYAMYYATRIEQDVSRYNVTLDHPFVWTADMVAALPTFNNDPPGVTPYFQIGFCNVKIFTPWVVSDGNRRVVNTEKALERVNTIATGSEQKVKFVDIVPWHKFQFALTGSKMSSAAAVNPMEKKFNSFDEFVCKFLLTAESHVLPMIERYKKSMPPMTLLKSKTRTLNSTLRCATCITSAWQSAAILTSNIMAPLKSMTRQ